MRFGILGPLTVVAGGTTGEVVTARRDRVVLAMLLLHAGRVVPFDELVDATWEDSPPATARAQLQTCVSRLRRALQVDGIVSDPAGYAIHVGADDLDASAFTRLIHEARNVVAEAPADARRLLRKSLDLWRGPALAGMDSRHVRMGAAVLDEQRATAVEDWVGLEIAAGRERALVAELSGLVEQFPLRERLRAQLMLALHRSGRQADALAEYRRGRALLLDELGIEPGPALQGLHRQILAGIEPVRNRPVVQQAAVQVRCLPRTVGDFTGRDDCIARVLKAIERGDPTGPVIQVIDGMAGSGKTTLVLHVAALVGDRYPDAQLFIDLHGHSEHTPVEPAAALVTLLLQLGVDAERIPQSLDERVALWRTRLAGRRTLVVLDNAAGTAQLTPLLPAARGCLTLITSRRRLSGLDGVRPESLQVLTTGEAVDLLTSIVGARVAAEPEAALEVVRRCGRLPLAIRLAGARLAHRPRWRVADLLRRLAEAALPELEAEDRSVASAFSMSYGQLEESARRTFRLLGLHPGERFDALAVAALTDLPLNDAKAQLATLVDVHLVEEPEPDLFRLHDLLREYAAALVAISESEDGRRTAITGMLDFHLHAFVAGNPDAQGWDLGRDLHMQRPGRPDLLAELTTPLAHLERERSSITAFIDAGLAVGRMEYAWQLPRAAWRYLWMRGYTDDVLALHRKALTTACNAGDEAAMAMSANYLASAHNRLADYPQALRLLEQCLTLCQKLGDVPGEGRALGNLSNVLEAMGELTESVRVGLAALQIARERNVTSLIRFRLNALAFVFGILGRYDEALRYQRRRLLFAVEEGDKLAIANSFLHIGVIKHRSSLADTSGCRRMLTAALRLQRQVGNSMGEAEVLNELGVLDRMEGRHREAADQHRAAIEIAARINDRRYECGFLNDLAVTAREAGDLDEALTLHRRGLAVARQIHQPYEEARALSGVATCLVGTHPGDGRKLWQQALTIFARMGVPERHEVERRLVEMDRDVDGPGNDLGDGAVEP